MSCLNKPTPAYIQPATDTPCSLPLNTQRILIVSANPRGTPELRIETEVREIAEGFRRSEGRNRFSLFHRTAVRPRDLHRALLDSKPNIVHFCGHGSEPGGLLLEDSRGFPLCAPNDVFVTLLGLVTTVQCVILNACGTLRLAEALARQVRFAIGTKSGLQDADAIEFAVGFYDALAAGETIPRAHAFGCAAMQLAGVENQCLPILACRSD